MPTLQLKGVDIDGSQFVCTGRQVAVVLDIMAGEPELIACDWYAGAIDSFGLAIDSYQEQEPRRVDHLDRFVETIRAAHQLLDGIVFAMRAGTEPILRGHVFTANGPMGRAVENSIVEMHAFDTSWIELYSDDLLLIRRFADRFPGGKWQN